MNKFKVLLLLVIQLIIFSIKIQAQTKTLFDATRLNRIAKVQQDQVTQGLIGSNRVLLFKDGKVVYDKIINSQKPGDHIINDKSLFPVWSMTKPIVTVATMILFEQGKLMLNDPIERYLPEMKDLMCSGDSGKIYPCKRKITVRDLLTHKSGWGYFTGMSNGKFFLISDTLYNDLKDFSEKVSKVPLAYEPGMGYSYGVSTSLLGRLIEAIAGVSLQEFLIKNIFIPLEMTDTKFDLSVSDRKQFQPLFRYENNQGVFTTEYDELTYREGSRVQLGGEGLVSTTTDYMHFCEMLLNKGTYKGKRILAPATIALMHEPIVPSGNEGEFAGFSFGFTFFNLTDQVSDGGLSPPGIFGWAGYHSTYFWIDQKNNLYGLIMMRRTPTYFSFWRKIRVATYQALIDAK